MNIIRRHAKNLMVNWAMEDNQFTEEIEKLKPNYPNIEFHIMNTQNKDIKFSQIFDECIMIMSGSIFKKNRQKIEENCFLYRVYIFDKMDHLYQNLQDDFPYIKTVTSDLSDIEKCIDEDEPELGKKTIKI